MTTSSRTAPSRSERTRFDIQALRAFAVLSVVGYHLWPLRLHGGFVGVDVFFVISGYLITAHLLREITTTGRIRLGQFWSRRAKRLLPAAFTTLLATGIAVLLVAPSSLWSQYAHELIASTFYVQNWQLASDSVNYLAVGNLASPFQHFWSLSVEEQFYIGLPILLTLLLLVLRLAKTASRITAIRVLLGVVIVLSFAWCVVETHTAAGIAYFSTATRAWEFALGGFVSTFAFAPSTDRQKTWAAGGTWLGVLLLLLSLVVITPETVFPGYAAALPVVGAALVVLLGGSSDLARIGTFAPIAFLGRISYSLYLWHWPAIVILPLVTLHAPTTKEKVGILVGSLVVASASTLLIEEPLRFSGWVKRARPLRVLVLGVAASAVVFALGAGTLTSVQAQQKQEAATAASLLKSPPKCFGAAADVGSSSPCVNPSLADVRVPSAARVAKDDSNLPQCWSTDSEDFNVCPLGPKTGYTKHLLAIGDSHNNVFVGAYAEIAKKNNWRIDVAGHISCYWTTSEQAAASQTLQDQCNSWKQKANAYVAKQKDLTAVIVTHSTTNSQVLPVAGKSFDAVTVDGLVGAWKNATDNGVPIIALADVPHARDDVVLCVSAMHGATTSACDRTRTNALRAFDGSKQALDVVKNGRLIDLSDQICDGKTCHAVIGGVVVYRDPTHLTATFAETLAPVYGARLKQAVASLGR